MEKFFCNIDQNLLLIYGHFRLSVSIKLGYFPMETFIDLSQDSEGGDELLDRIQLTIKNNNIVDKSVNFCHKYMIFLTGYWISGSILIQFYSVINPPQL